jgi:hypothetical protein
VTLCPVCKVKGCGLGWAAAAMAAAAAAAAALCALLWVGVVAEPAAAWLGVVGASCGATTQHKGLSRRVEAAAAAKAEAKAEAEGRGGEAYHPARRRVPLRGVRGFVHKVIAIRILTHHTQNTTHASHHTTSHA